MKMAASIAWTRGVPLEIITTRSFWRSPNVFITGYLVPGTRDPGTCVALGTRHNFNPEIVRRIARLRREKDCQIVVVNRILIIMCLSGYSYLDISFIREKYNIYIAEPRYIYHGGFVGIKIFSLFVKISC